MLTGCTSVSAIEPAAGTWRSDSPPRAAASFSADSAALVRLIAIDASLLPMLHVRVTDGVGTWRFRSSDFSTTTANGPGFDPQVAPFTVRSPGTVVVDVVLLAPEPTDTLAALTFTGRVYSNAIHTAVISLGGSRPIGIMENQIHVTRLRGANPGYPHDTIFVVWAFHARVSPPGSVHAAPPNVTWQLTAGTFGSPAPTGIASESLGGAPIGAAAELGRSADMHRGCGSGGS